jgi:predicted lipase
VQQLGRKKKNWKFILLGIVISLNGCAKSVVDNNNDLGSGGKNTLPVTITSLIEHAEYCKTIYDSGGNQKDEVAFEVKQVEGISIIVIRGTANESNVQSDIDVRLVKDDDLGIYLHKGFRDAAVIIMQSLDNSYTIEHTVHVTGHSLGGAVAQIIGMWFHKRGKNVQIYSYGSPKVSSEVLVSGQPLHWRVSNPVDPVPWTPPFPFLHTGLFIDPRDGDWGPDNDNGLISKTDGLTHAVAKYVESLKGLLQ